MTGLVTLTTTRLALVASTPEIARAAVSDGTLLAELLQARVPATWPPAAMARALEGYARRLEEEPALAGWLPRYWVALEERVLVGAGGFGRRPDDKGTLEIGYVVFDEFQRRGYASEAVAALLDWAFVQPGVERVYAKTARSGQASLRVLEKNRFRLRGTGPEPHMVWLEITRARWRSARRPA